MAKTGRAVIYEGHREPPDVFRIVEYPVPEPRPGAVLLRITLANICGSDVHTYRGESRNRHVTEPRNPGHEGTGHVAALGEGVTTDSNGEALAVGDRVIFGHFYYCGRCRACLAGREWCCPTRRAHMNASSAELAPFPGHVRGLSLPSSGAHPLQGAPGLADHVVSGINCALTQVHCGFDVAGLALGETVVIQGAGGLGIYAIAEARERGAARIIVVDGVQERLDLALEFGADDLVDMRELKTPAERIRRVKELTSGWGADLVLEVVGYPSVVEEGLQMVGSGGRYVEMGCRAPHPLLHRDPRAVGDRAISRSSGATTTDGGTFDGAIEFLSRTQSRYPYHKIVSHSFPLQRVNEAFAAAEHRPRDAREPGALTASRETIAMDLGIKGRRAIVTGGSTGIGRATARGAALAGSARRDLRPRRGPTRADAQGAGGGSGRRGCRRADRHAKRAPTSPASWTRPPVASGVSTSWSTTPAPFTAGRFDATTDEGMQNQLNTKLFGFLRAIRLVAPQMKERGWGRIVNIIGGAGKEPDPFMLVSGVTNSALLNLTKSLATEFGPFNVLVNAVCPGWVDTAVWRNNAAGWQKELGVDLGRGGAAPHHSTEQPRPLRAARGAREHDRVSVFGAGELHHRGLDQRGRGAAEEPLVARSLNGQSRCRAARPCRR